MFINRSEIECAAKCLQSRGPCTAFVYETNEKTCRMGIKEFATYPPQGINMNLLTTVKSVQGKTFKILKGLCILTNFGVLHTPKRWSKTLFWGHFHYFVHVNQEKMFETFVF